MTYRSDRDNLIALILVLMISLITSPASGMPSHQSHVQATAESSHQPVETTGSDCHQAVHQASISHYDCCADMVLSSPCSDCSSAHCQAYSSALPAETGTITSLSRERLVPQMSALQPVSRTESLFRPPIA